MYLVLKPKMTRRRRTRYGSLIKLVGVWIIPVWCDL